jgi:FkbM family methyltransferase
MPNPILSLAARMARLLPDTFKQALYKIDPLARLLRGVLNRAAPEGLSTVTVAAGMLVGAQLELDLQAEKDYWLGTYELELQAAIAAHVQPGMTAYDVGANIGYISLGLARAVGAEGQVWSFEALPANQQRLRANVALNPDLRVNVVPQAVTGESGTVDFLVHASGGMGKAAGSAGRAADYAETIAVPAVSLDDFVYAQGNPAPQVVKIDIEGGEVMALPGMTRVLHEARPVVFLELHGPEAAQVAWDTLTAAGYTLHRMEKDYPVIPALDVLDWKAYLMGLPG